MQKRVLHGCGRLKNVARAALVARMRLPEVCLKSKNRHQNRYLDDALVQTTEARKIAVSKR